MSTLINHHYGTAINGIPPLLAIPVVGIVTVTIKDKDDKSVGTTTTNTNGEWKQSFSLEDGTYTVEFKGRFKPIGSGFRSSYHKTLTSFLIRIAVPLTADIENPADPDIGETGPIGREGPIGKTGPEGPIGSQGIPGEQGPTGPLGLTGEIGIIGPAGPPGTDGSPGVIGPAGSRGLQGIQGIQGNQGPQGPIGLSTAASTTANVTKSLFLENPTATDFITLGFFTNGRDIDSIKGFTNNGTVTFNIYYTDEEDPGGTGIALSTSNILADSDGATGVGLQNIPNDKWAFYQASSIDDFSGTGVPAQLWVKILP